MRLIAPMIWRTSALVGASILIFINAEAASPLGRSRKIFVEFDPKRSCEIADCSKSTLHCDRKGKFIFESGETFQESKVCDIYIAGATCDTYELSQLCKGSPVFNKKRALSQCTIDPLEVPTFIQNQNLRETDAIEGLSTLLHESIHALQAPDCDGATKESLSLLSEIEFTQTIEKRLCSPGSLEFDAKKCDNLHVRRASIEAMYWVNEGFRSGLSPCQAMYQCIEAIYQPRSVDPMGETALIKGVSTCMTTPYLTDRMRTNRSSAAAQCFSRKKMRFILPELLPHLLTAEDGNIFGFEINENTQIEF